MSNGATPIRSNVAVPLLGLALGAAALLVYGLAIFGLGAYMPTVRNDAGPVWLVLAVGVALTLLGVRRALARPRAARRLVLPGTALALNLAFAAALAWVLYAATDLPAAGGPAVGAPAPAFTLTDQDGRRVQLTDFRGAPLLLVFYRGHW